MWSKGGGSLSKAMSDMSESNEGTIMSSSRHSKEALEWSGPSKAEIFPFTFEDLETQRSARIPQVERRQGFSRFFSCPSFFLSASSLTQTYSNRPNSGEKGHFTGRGSFLP